MNARLLGNVGMRALQQKPVVLVYVHLDVGPLMSFNFNCDTVYKLVQVVLNLRYALFHEVRYPQILSWLKVPKVTANCITILS